jgi:hypothetical protein
MKNTLAIAFMLAATTQEVEAVSMKSLVEASLQDDNVAENPDSATTDSGDEADSEETDQED